MITRDFRVGDKVTCNTFGKGEIVSIGNGVYPIKVKSSNGIFHFYLKEGKWDSSLKRSLFIIPKKKPTLSEVRAKYKELQSTVEEVGYVDGKDNYYVYRAHDDCGEYTFEANYHNSAERFNMKYISKEDADIIVKTMEEFVKID